MHENLILTTHYNPQIILVSFKDMYTTEYNYQMKTIAAIALLENGPEGLVVLLDVLQSFQTTFQSV